MPYRRNLGCLWIALLILLLGGTPLLVGVLRIFAGLIVILVVVGLAATWWIRRNAVLHYTNTRTERHKDFVENLVALLVRLAEIDGELDRREVTVIRQFFQNDLGYKDEQLLWIRDLIKASRKRTDDVRAICEELREGFMLQERVIVLQILARVANADGKVTQGERDFVEQVARYLGLESFIGGFRFGTGPGPGGAGAGYGGAGAGSYTPPDRIEEAYATLGLAHGADAETIKNTWRSLSKENHPDRMAHLGEEFQRLADERMREINAAYETLKEAGLAQ